MRDMTDIPPSTRRPALEVEGLTKRYGYRVVLQDLSLSVPTGEIFGILGANGAGKTTAVEIVQGLRPRDAGRVRVLGFDPARDHRRLRHVVGSQLQSSALPDRLRVGEALRLFARLAGDVVDWRELRDGWDLGPLERRPFGALSGGERQRLFVALALVNRPRLVFLDELSQGLDAGARRDTWRLIEQVRDQGATVVLVTHFMDEAERLCDRVAVLHDSRIVADGTPAELVTATHLPVRIGFSGARPVELTGVDRVPGVATVSFPRPDRVEIVCLPHSVVPVVAELDRRGIAPADLTVAHPSLEDAFVTLTGGDPK